MDIDYSYVPHPRHEERKTQPPPKVQEQAPTSTVLQRFNSRVGLGITLVVGTMWCAYLFTVLALVSAPAAFSSGMPLIIVAWIAQTFLQLVLLPIIIVGQNLQSKAADQRAIQTYQDAEAILHDAKEIQAHLDAQDKVLSGLIAKLAAIEAGSAKG